MLHRPPLRSVSMTEQALLQLLKYITQNADAIIDLCRAAVPIVALLVAGYAIHALVRLTSTGRKR
jgi:hypothetical protein